MSLKKYTIFKEMFFFLAFFLLLSAAPVFAVEGTLTWNQDINQTLLGYKVHVGSESENYAYSIDVGLRNSFHFKNLEPKKDYTFAVTAYNAEGLESDFSDELLSQTPSGAPLGYRLISGLGNYPDNGGWMELRGADYIHDSWLQIDWEEYNSENGESRVASGDIDGDGKDEIIVGLARVDELETIPEGWFSVYDDDYSLLTAGQIQWPEYNKINGESWPACGDINGDGKDEIILGLGPEGQGFLEIFSFHSGTLIHMDWIQIEWEDYNQSGGTTHPACGDIDKDGLDEIIVGLSQVADNAFIPDGWFQIFDHDLSPLAWGQIDWPDYNAVNGASWPSCGDVDGNGREEIILGLGQGGKGKFETLAFMNGNATHQEWNEVNWADYNYLIGETRPTCGDFDLDQKDEVLIGLGQGGKAVMQIFDDVSEGGLYLTSLQIGFEDYQSANGETLPTVVQLVGPNLLRRNLTPLLNLILF